VKQTKSLFGWAVGNQLMAVGCMLWKNGCGNQNMFGLAFSLLAKCHHKQA
jgi:hypothetical protein